MIKRAYALFGAALTLGLPTAVAAQDEMNPAMMTCEEIVEMEEDQARDAIYFAAGYQYGQMGGGITGTTGTAATGLDTGTDTTAGAAPGTTGMADTGMMASLDFEQISVDEIRNACEDSPDQLVMNVLREHAEEAAEQ